MAVMDALVMNLMSAACLYPQTIRLDSVFAKKKSAWERQQIAKQMGQIVLSFVQFHWVVKKERRIP